MDLAISLYVSQLENTGSFPFPNAFKLMRGEKKKSKHIAKAEQRLVPDRICT